MIHHINYSILISKIFQRESIMLDSRVLRGSCLWVWLCGWFIIFEEVIPHDLVIFGKLDL